MVDFRLLAVQSVFRKKARSKILHFRQLDHELAIVSFPVFSHPLTKGKLSSEIKIGFNAVR